MDAQTFRQWYYSFSPKEKPVIKEKILRSCCLNPDGVGRFQVFCNWCYTTTKVPPLAQKVINAIAGKELIYPSKNKNA